MPPLLNLIGQRFGYWVVLERDRETTSRQARWWCRCDCGECDGVIKSLASADLRNGDTRSCGSLQRKATIERSTKHGHAQNGGSREYHSWAAMIQRCMNPNNPKYDNYGGRGIRVHETWMEFENFFADMGACPEGNSLDRIDVDGDYEPENCQWASASEQEANRRPRGRIVEKRVIGLAEQVGLEASDVMRVLEAVGVEVC